MGSLEGLIKAAKEGDELALGKLFHWHKRLIEWHAYHKWNMRHCDLQDVSQRVFIRLPETLKIMTSITDGGFRSMMFKVTDQECIKIYRTWKRKWSKETGTAEAHGDARPFRTYHDVFWQTAFDDAVRKLTDAERLALNTFIESGERLPSLYNARTRFSHIWTGHKHVPRKRDLHGVGESANRSKLNDDKVRLIRRLYFDDDMTIASIARQVGVGETCIRDVVKGYKWTHVI